MGSAEKNEGRERRCRANEKKPGRNGAKQMEKRGREEVTTEREEGR